MILGIFGIFGISGVIRIGFLAAAAPMLARFSSGGGLDLVGLGRTLL